MIEVENLKTERLELKKISFKDLDDYVEWKEQEEYHKFLPTYPRTKKEYKKSKSFKSLVKSYKDQQKSALHWGIFLNNKLIGSVSIQSWNKYKCCEIGWGLNPKFQNHGYAYEATKCLINYIFDELKMNRISVSVWEGNEPSKKLTEKLGFVQEGIERKARIKDEKCFDVYHYGLLKEEWATKQH